MKDEETIQHPLGPHLDFFILHSAFIIFPIRCLPKSGLRDYTAVKLGKNLCQRPDENLSTPAKSCASSWAAERARGSSRSPRTAPSPPSPSPANTASWTSPSPTASTPASVA